MARTPRRQKHVKPPWYVREEYAPLYELPAIELVEQVALRTEVLKTLPENREFARRLRNHGYSAYPWILEDGLFLEDRAAGPRLPLRDKFQQFVHMMKMREEYHTDVELAPIVKLLEGMREFTDVRHDRTLAVKPLSECDAQNLLPDTNSQSDSHFLIAMLQPLDKAGNAKIHIAIDLRYPDEAILQDIRALLPKWRKRLKAYSVRRRPRGNFTKWAKKRRVVEFLDLFIWSRLNGFTYTNSELCDLVFPEGGSIDPDNIKKTILNDIHTNLMDDAFLDHWRTVSTNAV